MTQPTPTPKPADSPTPAAGRSAVGPWNAISILIVLAALVLIVLIVAAKWKDAKDATSVLGVVIPVFATIGAGVFGIQVGYTQGQSAGTATGQATGEKNGRKQVAQSAKAVLQAQPHTIREGEDIRAATADPLAAIHGYLDGIIAE